MLFVLKRSQGVPMLYYYRDVKKRWQKQTPKGVVVLSPWLQVSIAHECSYKFSFTIKHPEGTVYLAAKDNDTMNNWIVNIQAQMTLNTKEGMYVCYYIYTNMFKITYYCFIVCFLFNWPLFINEIFHVHV